MRLRWWGKGVLRHSLSGKPAVFLTFVWNPSVRFGNSVQLFTVLILLHCLYFGKFAMSDSDPATGSTDHASANNENTQKMEEFPEPDAKRRKISNRPADDKKSNLAERLGGILCCVVCLDLPRAAIYQCVNGHLMCVGCLTHLLADARLRDETATCPTCRVEISKTSSTRNLAVENAVSELPSECRYCGAQFPRNSLGRHETQECEDRIANCKYSRIGCPWRGPKHEQEEHESACVHAKKSGAEVMQALQALDEQTADEKKLYNSIFDLLGYDNITFNDIQLKPYRTDEFINRLYYESSRFSAFGNQWVVKARINNTQKDPTQSSERDMTYQITLKSRSTPLNISYLALAGPVGGVEVRPRIYEFEFSDDHTESNYVQLPLRDTDECNRLLAAKTINFRYVLLFSFDSASSRNDL
ncbi:unnamed protein product [Acanthoscelides obtectus]|uniref:Cysteine and histidine-rich protein 1 n=1 Tax=Acanthoscelides obtectus TaxID=200917 RepID=A0A9P0JTA1_ACAOB|nr:unnamed protein product [Acanthoscelides obtectus]CAK1679035.1 Cysteine and histidine-rich protein 1 homolog [Acanthoscelides obtectus]